MKSYFRHSYTQPGSGVLLAASLAINRA